MYILCTYFIITFTNVWILFGKSKKKTSAFFGLFLEAWALKKELIHDLDGVLRYGFEGDLLLEGVPEGRNASWIIEVGWKVGGGFFQRSKEVERSCSGV